MALRRKITEALDNSTLFFEDIDKQWKLVDPARASAQLAAIRDNYLRRSDTFSLPGQSRIEQPPKKKRRHKRELGKYERTIEVLEDLCKDCPKSDKNPFVALKPGMGKGELLQTLGSGDKTLGILQCFNYFAPLIQAGIKKSKSREEAVATKSNLLQVSETLKKLTDQLKKSGAGDAKE